MTGEREEEIFLVSEEYAGARLDAALASLAGVSRSAAVRAIEGGEVLLNGGACEKKRILAAGDRIAYFPDEPEEWQVLPEEIPLDILYEDADLLVVNKPSGMVVHPAAGNRTGTLVNALLYHCKDSLSGVGGVIRPGIVHRIDKDTSGLLVVAKNDFTHLRLSEDLSHHGIVREYHALANGGFRESRGTVDLPIGRHPVDRKKMAVLAGDPNAKRAVTHYELLEDFGKISYLKLILETGRTHQIRVHLSHIGHPLLGDEVYGGGRTPFEKQHKALLDGQALHAKALAFTHPRTGEPMRFESPLPENFEKLLAILRAGRL